MWTNQFIKTIAIIIISVLLFILLPILLIILSPFFIYRWILSILIPRLVPNLIQLLDPFSSAFAVKNIYIDPIFGVAGIAVIDNKFQLSQLIESFQNNVLNVKDWNGDLVYGELQCKVSKFMGYLWWEKIPQFKLEDYIKYYNGKLTSDNNMIGSVDWNENNINEIILKIIEEYLQQTFKPDSSPWEILVINQKYGNDSLLVFRFHHCLSAGPTWMNLVEAWCSNSPEQFKLMKVSSPSILIRVLHFIKRIIQIFLLGPFILVSQAINAYDRNEWTKINLDEWTDQINVNMTHEIPLRMFKELLSKYNVDLLTLYLSTYTNALKSAMLELNIKIPNKMHCMISIPYFNHPGSNIDTMKLGNPFTVLFLELPIHEEDEVKRLYLVDQRIKKLIRWSVGEINHLFANIFSSLPVLFQFPQTTHVGPTTLFVTQPPISKLSLFNTHHVKSFIATTKFLPGLGPVGGSLVYDGKVKFFMAADYSIISNPQILNNMNNRILKELDILLNKNTIQIC